MEKPRSVSRCVAIASHGRRCQQSPFRGSPYCWHHTQSRKIFAPSRLTAGSGAVRLVDGAVSVPLPAPEGPRAERRGGAERRSTARGEREELERATRLARALGPEQVEALLRFVEDPHATSYTLAREPAPERADREHRTAGRARARRAG